MKTNNANKNIVEAEDRICKKCDRPKSAFVSMCEKCEWEASSATNNNLGYSKGQQVYV